VKNTLEKNLHQDRWTRS